MCVYVCVCVRVCACVGEGGRGDGKWLGDASFTSDFYHARLTRNSIPICK